MSGEPATDRLIIEGIREDTQKVFRPSNWAERVSAVLASFGSDHKLRYSEFAQPCIIDGKVCLIVAKGLEDSDPEAFGFIMRFARENHLRILEDRRKDKGLPGSSPSSDV